MYLQIDVDDNRIIKSSIVQSTKVTAIEVALLCDRLSGKKLASYAVSRTVHIFISFHIF